MRRELVVRTVAGEEGDASSPQLADGYRCRRRSVRSANGVLAQPLYEGVETRAAEYPDLSLEQRQSLEAFEDEDPLVSDFFESDFVDSDFLSEEALSELEDLSDELSEEPDSDFLSADSPDFLDGER
jgi:hypothetical protein